MNHDQLVTVSLKRFQWNLVIRAIALTAKSFDYNSYTHVELESILQTVHDAQKETKP